MHGLADWILTTRKDYSVQGLADWILTTRKDYSVQGRADWILTTRKDYSVQGLADWILPSKRTIPYSLLFTATHHKVLGWITICSSRQLIFTPLRKPQD